MSLLGCALMLSMPVAMLVSLWKSIQRAGFFRTIKNILQPIAAVTIVFLSIGVPVYLFAMMINGHGLLPFIHIWWLPDWISC